jgi:acyl-coenzyme A thioesterase PaaI-like protein
MSFCSTDISKNYDRTLKDLQGVHHSQCFFQHDPPVDNLRFRFSDDGTLIGRFICSTEHQGYDGVVHGGIIAAIIDASMVQCCMGHGIAAYTADLSIRYRSPLRISTPTLLETRIVGRGREVLFSLESNISQEGQTQVAAAARFFKLP